MVALRIPLCFDFLDAELNLEYVVAMASNAVLQRKAEEAMQYARGIAAVTGQTEQVYSDVSYAAGSWERRILIKAEVVCGEGKEPKDNPRFVITNMKQGPNGSTKRSTAARRDREPHQGTARSSDRSHQLQPVLGQPVRVMLTAAAYVLMQELRLRAAYTNRARAQVWTLRERLLKLGAAWRSPCGA